MHNICQSFPFLSFLFNFCRPARWTYPCLTLDVALLFSNLPASLNVRNAARSPLIVISPRQIDCKDAHLQTKTLSVLTQGLVIHTFFVNSRKHILFIGVPIINIKNNHCACTGKFYWCSKGSDSEQEDEGSWKRQEAKGGGRTETTREN